MMAVGPPVVWVADRWKVPSPLRSSNPRLLQTSVDWTTHYEKPITADQASAHHTVSKNSLTVDFLKPHQWRGRERERERERVYKLKKKQAEMREKIKQKIGDKDKK